MSLQLMLKTLIRALYSLHSVRPIYSSIIYIFIYLNLMNIRLLIRPNAIKSCPRTSIKNPILLLTGCTVALISLKSIFLWICLTATTFSSNLSGSCKVVTIYMGSYGVYWHPSQTRLVIS